MQPGKEFEEAVFRFVAALDQNAQVYFDHKVPDRETGNLIQCDIWIEAQVGGHWPVSILVSCKDRKESGRKLGSPDIRTFLAEVEATGATMGVIYCNTSFTIPAIEKARANKVACCRLYQNEPADLPDVVWFDWYACTPMFMLKADDSSAIGKFKKWNDLFDREIEMDDKGSFQVIDVIMDAQAQGESWSVEQIMEQRGFPPDWKILLTLKMAGEETRVHVIGKWRKYRAKAEATYLDGSYNYTNELYSGSQAGPSIDMKSDHPGEHWIEIEEPDHPTNYAVAILYAGDKETAKQRLREMFGNQPITPNIK